MALYMLHWPAFTTNFWCNDAFVEGLGDCWEQGLCEAVGVSNFRADRVHAAAKALEVCGPRSAETEFSAEMGWNKGYVGVSAACSIACSKPRCWRCLEEVKACRDTL